MTITRFDHSNALYERALRTIPLASQTFSKSAMTFVRGASPLFLERGQGPRVWDVDGNRYLDYVLGLMPVILGYRDPDVDRAIRDQLERGITLSLPTELEIDLAERLVRLIPCAEMVRFGKNGSDVTSAATRLARAHTGRERIAVTGYHGWHDWYIGTTTRHLGVPEPVRGLSVSVPFNDADALESLLQNDPNGFAAVVMEPAGVSEPQRGYLERVRKLTEKYGVVLVFDEIVTGFRIDLGGAQKRYGVTPDLACFGKAMGNGMPISAVVGHRSIMRRMDEIFFSGTFGGETLSLAAALVTIDKLERENGPAVLTDFGARMAQEIAGLIETHELSNALEIGGVDWWPRILVHETERAPAQTVTSLLRQELIASGILMGGGFNLSMAHQADPAVLTETLDGFGRAFERVATALGADDPGASLRGEPVQPVFQVRND